MQFHDDTLDREEFIVKYLAGKAPAASADAFESHYLIALSASRNCAPRLC